MIEHFDRISFTHKCKITTFCIDQSAVYISPKRNLFSSKLLCSLLGTETTSAFHIVILANYCINDVFMIYLWDNMNAPTPKDINNMHYVCRRKICSCKLNPVAKCHGQISVTKVSELSNINNICFV